MSSAEIAYYAEETRGYKMRVGKFEERWYRSWIGKMAYGANGWQRR